MAIVKFKRAIHPSMVRDVNDRLWSDVTEALPEFIAITATHDPASVAADSFLTESITVTGVLSTDVIVGIQHPAFTTGFMVSDWRVSADDTIDVTFENETGGPLDEASGTWTFVLMRMEA